jgi:P27 family predicted phage terminase small subunit
MSRTRKPIEQHKLEGTYQRCRHGARRDIDGGGNLADSPPPAHLNAAEAAIWREVLRVAPSRLLREADAAVVERFVCAIAACREASALRAQTSLLVKSSHADRAPIINPLNGEIRRLSYLICELARQLGCTPQSRLRLTDGVGPEAEPLDAEFIQEFGGLRVVVGGDHA